MADNINYEQLAKTLLANMSATAQKGVVSGSVPAGTMAHGRGGLFSTPGMERQVFSAMTLPVAGVQSMLPLRASNTESPLFGIFTGVTASTGSEPTNVCDDPPTVGLSKMMTHSFVWGRMSRQTQVYDLDRFGRRNNRSEFDDFQFYGNPEGLNDFWTPTTGAGALSATNRDVRKIMFEFGVAWQRDFARLLYTGNPTNNTAGGGYKEFYGLDYLINTGYRDAETGIAAPAVDSLIRDFASADVASNGVALVRQLTNMYRNLRFIATRAGLDPVRWVITMPWSLFYEISAIWPCAYETHRCDLQGSNNQAWTDRGRLNDMTDAMRGNVYDRTGQYLLIDGAQVPVVLDDGISEAPLAGSSFRSNIYFVPLTVLGGTPVTYLEYLPYTMDDGAMEAARALAPEGMFYTSDNGRFLWHKKLPNNFCVQLLAKTEPRLILLTPHLAGRLNNVKWTPFAHERQHIPGESFYLNGGRTSAGSVPSILSPR